MHFRYLHLELTVFDLFIAQSLFDIFDHGFIGAQFALIMLDLTLQLGLKSGCLFKIDSEVLYH